MTNTDENERIIDYRESFVAYLDVLGFKKMLINRPKELEGYFKRILGLKKVMHNTRINGHENEIKMKMMSDAIILSLPSDQSKTAIKEDFMLICFAVAIVQVVLARRGIWLRGGISYGEFSQNDRDDITVGKALADAYILESEHACFPRVIVDPNIFKKLNVTRNDLITFKTEDNSLSNVIYSGPEFDEGDRASIFVDYLGNFLLSNSTTKELGNEVLDEIYTCLKESLYGNQKFYPKHQWTRRYIASVLKNLKNHHCTSFNEWIGRFGGL